MDVDPTAAEFEQHHPPRHPTNSAQHDSTIELENADERYWLRPLPPPEDVSIPHGLGPRYDLVLVIGKRGTKEKSKAEQEKRQQPKEEEDTEMEERGQVKVLASGLGVEDIAFVEKGLVVWREPAASSVTAATSSQDASKGEEATGDDQTFITAQQAKAEDESDSGEKKERNGFFCTVERWRWIVEPVPEA